jgi:hypothetical protein
VQIFPTVGVNTTGETTDTIQNDARVLLPGGPHYAILDVAVIDPDPADPFINAATGYVHFPVRTNVTPVAAASAGTLEYQVINHDPATAQSQIQLEEIEIDPAYDGGTLRVRYETLVGMGTIHNYTRDRIQRVLAANILVRGFFPIYLAFIVPYQLGPRATGTVDEDAMRVAVVDFINNFDPRDIIDVSDIVQVVRDFDSNIGTVFNFTIQYSLLAADGRLIPYMTSDIVDLDPDKIVAGTATDFANPVGQSVSDATVRYMALPTDIFFEDQLNLTV